MGSIYDPADAALGQSLALAGQYLNCGLIVCKESRDYETVYVNDSFPRLLGYSHDEFVIKYPRFSDCIHPEDRGHVSSALAEALALSDRYHILYRVTGKDGGMIWIRESGTRVLTSDGSSRLVCLLIDISEDMAARREIENKSRSDPLTGILNRAAFVEWIEALLSEHKCIQRRHALIMLDVDHFKAINDTLGHGYGDRVLEDVAQKLKSFVRAGDMVGRLGGDEFLICLKDIRSDASINNRLAQICVLLHRTLPQNVPLTCSLGAAFYPVDGASFEQLYRCADIALYEAKKAGRNQFIIYTPDMDKNGFLHGTTPIDNPAG